MGMLQQIRRLFIDKVICKSVLSVCHKKLSFLSFSKLILLINNFYNLGYCDSGGGDDDGLAPGDAGGGADATAGATAGAEGCCCDGCCAAAADVEVEGAGVPRAGVASAGWGGCGLVFLSSFSSSSLR